MNKDTTSVSGDNGSGIRKVRFAVLGSGSSANAYIFEYDGTAVAVDNGFSCKEFLRRTAEAGFDAGRIALILLTHVHSDHIKGISTLSKRLKAPVGLHHELSVKEWLPKGIHSRKAIEPGAPVECGPFVIHPFLSSHDAPFSVNYQLVVAGRIFTIITDTGIIIPPMTDLAGSSDILFLEANYSPPMLAAGPYPEDLKKRIASKYGHLSNADAVDFMNTLWETGRRMPKLIFLCHLSDINNSPEVLKEYLRLNLKAGFRVQICPKKALCLPPEDFHLSAVLE